MTPFRSLALAALLAALIGAGFAWFVRLPLPFDGFAMAAAAGVAFLATLSLTAWMPPRWLWTDAELLRRAFQAQHGISEQAAGNALSAITEAHDRARTLRKAARAMRTDMTERVNAVADRLDASAREIFYTPDRHRQLRAILVRSELIEDAALAHAKLRARKQTETEAASREKLMAALKALDTAFDEADLQAAQGLLTEVEVASNVAETLLTRTRRP